jgi:hypothetical protein
MSSNEPGASAFLFAPAADLAASARAPVADERGRQRDPTQAGPLALFDARSERV